ncbi:MAG TPA: ankyrin repeat domain-containing protein, partial [Thermodesulfovibrionia bacterium]|nr:ankyrin repeat domain-containing protein [Thermodesulfovibrionia bacterium]
YGDMANGITPLIMASKYGHTDIVKILLDKGADVNAKMLFLGKSETPLSNAEKEGHTEIVKLLKDAGAKE